MKVWSEWEIARQQVAISGRVADRQGKAVPGARVNLTVVPEELKARLTGAASAARDWATRDERPDRTVARDDGLFFFLDLPPGKYTVEAMMEGKDAGSKKKKTWKAHKAVPILWDAQGNVKRAVVDLVLAVDREPS
ncbi:MAG: carboxypeptidase-like regulatory domain-containing protein [Gammaproteobacteria bacterium]